MNKKFCSVSIAIIIVFAACRQTAKQNNAAIKMADIKTKSGMASISSQIKQDDSSASRSARMLPGKASCCVAPPSRVKIKVEKK